MSESGRTPSVPTRLLRSAESDKSPTKRLLCAADISGPPYLTACEELEHARVTQSVGSRAPDAPVWRASLAALVHDVVNDARNYRTALLGNTDFLRASRS